MKAVIATFLLLTTFVTVSYSQASPRIKNYKSFVKAFKATNAAIDYKKNKKRIEELSVEVKNSGLPLAKKEELEGSYKKITLASQKLYDELMSDLKSTDRRKEIFDSPDPYMDSLENRIKSINSMCADFEASYTATQSGTKARKVVIIVVKEIIIPLAVEFVNEVILPQVIQRYGEKHLRPQLVFKSW